MVPSFLTLSGEFFCEYSFIDSKPASASIIAKEPSELFKMTKDDYEKVISSNDSIAKIIYYNMLNEMIKRLREKDKELDIFTF